MHEEQQRQQEQPKSQRRGPDVGAAFEGGGGLGLQGGAGTTLSMGRGPLTR